MANENLLGIKKHCKVSEHGSGIFSNVESREASEAKAPVAVESLKAKFLSMMDKLKKMDEIIEDIKIKLCKSKQELDESMGI